MTLVVLHGFGLHYIASAAGPPGLPAGAVFANAVPYLFHADAVARAAAGFEAKGNRQARARVPAGAPDARHE